MQHIRCHMQFSTTKKMLHVHPRCGLGREQPAKGEDREASSSCSVGKRCYSRGKLTRTKTQRVPTASSSGRGAVFQLQPTGQQTQSSRCPQRTRSRSQRSHERSWTSRVGSLLPNLEKGTLLYHFPRSGCRKSKKESCSTTSNAGTYRRTSTAKDRGYIGWPLSTG
jgi:hypothetical protein